MPKQMSDTIIAALIPGVLGLLSSLITYHAIIRAAHIEATSKISQAGVVGEEGVKNQVSPRPPDEN